jgi:hypothetical protein
MNLKLRTFFTFLFIVSLPHLILGKTFLEWHEKVNKGEIHQSEFDKFISTELRAAVLTGNYKRYLNAHYLQYEKNHRGKKEVNKSYEIIQQNELRKQSKFIEHDLYFQSTIGYLNYFVDYNKKLIVLLNLNDYLNRFNLIHHKETLYIAIADCYYKLNNYQQAINYWHQSFKFIYKKNHLQISSIFNNIACAYDKDKNLRNAIKFNIKAQLEMEKIKKKDINEKSFYLNLIANKGFYAKSSGDLKTAFKLFKIIYENYLADENFHSSLVDAAVELMMIEQNPKKINFINIEKIELIFNELLKENGQEELKGLNFRFLIKYNEIIKDYKKAYNYLEEYNSFVDAKNAEKIDRLNLTNQLLQEEKVREEVSKANLLNESERKKNNLIYISAFVVTLLLFTMLLLYQRNKRKDTKLKLKEKELELSQKAVVEKELLLKKELAANLELSLSVKKKSEEVFLEKLKELKRKKNNDPDELLKELQLQIMNLFQIDKKQSSKNAVRNKKDNTFIANLRELHPELTEQELRLCSYFRMGLSGKEISQLEQQLAASSIKVIKNRIKRKLNLAADVKLDDYLNGVG